MANLANNPTELTFEQVDGPFERPSGHMQEQYGWMREALRANEGSWLQFTFPDREQAAKVTVALTNPRTRLNENRAFKVTQRMNQIRATYQPNHQTTNGEDQ